MKGSFSLILLAACFAFAPQSVRAGGYAPKINYHANWLKGQQGITAAAFRDLLTLAHKDRISKTIVQKAVAKLHLSKEQDLIRIFHLFDSTETELSGRTTYEFMQQEFVGLSNDDLLKTSGVANASDPVFETQIKKVSEGLAAAGTPVFVFTYTYVSSDFLQIRVLGQPQIYLSPKSSLEEAYCNFIHELFHFVTLDLAYTPDYLQYANAEEFALDQINRTPSDRGLNEVDAYQISIGAVLRMEYPNEPLFLRIDDITTFFNSKGEYTGDKDRREFAKYLLSEDGYDYYDSHFRAKFMSGLTTSHGVELYMYDKINALLIEREAAIHELQSESAINAEDEWNLELLKESKARLITELQQRKQRIDKLAARIKDLSEIEED